MATITPINVGTVPNDDTGDSLRNAFIKVNTNEANLNTGITTNAAITGGAIDGTIIGGTTAATASFTGVIVTTGDLDFNTTSRGINVLNADVATNFDINFPEVSTTAATVRIFRDTNTTGGYRYIFFKGDGTSGAQHDFADGTRNSFVNLQGGNFGIGLSGATEKVDALGNIKASGIFLAGDGTPAAPAYSFTNSPITGLHSPATNELGIAVNGAARWLLSFGTFKGVITNGPAILNIASTATIPNLLPRSNDGNTGVGSNGADQLSLIAGGVEGLRITTVGGIADSVFDNNIIANVIEVGSFTVATLPSASAAPNGIIKVSDETGGETLAFSDGTNFRRVQDRAIVA